MEAQAFTYDVCRGYVQDLADTHPFKDKLLGLLRSRNLKGLCESSKLVNVQSIDVDTFKSLLQVEAFFKKNEAFSERDRCLKAAQESFVLYEAQCAETNKRLEDFYLHPDQLDPDMELIIKRARSWIDSVLGDLGAFIETVPSSIRFTAGATADTSKRNSLPFMKVKRKPLATSRSVPYVEALFRFCNLKAPLCRETLMNRVEFVPKNWKTYRTIACEPEGTLPFQLAFDRYVKGRLRKRGINLSDQSRNQELARLGSIDGSFATIDLSAASDTVSLNCVAWLFPATWFKFMSDLRCSVHKCPLTGDQRIYEKFSSMGNGMTFCIETLVFASLLRACGDKQGVVYGDDICVEAEYVPMLVKALQFFGFTVNLEKSFFEGPYRESCGTHWFNGVKITPFFLRGNLKLKPFQAHAVNGLVSVTRPHGKVWFMLREFVYSQNIHLVPFNEASISGVWIDFRNAVKLKKVVTRNWISYARLYEFRSAVVLDTGIRSLLLWYHDSFRVRETPLIGEARQRSRYSVPLEKFRRRRVVIHKCDESSVAHLPMWSTYLIRES